MSGQFPTQINHPCFEHWRRDPSLAQRDATPALGPRPCTARPQCPAHCDRLLTIRYGRASRVHMLGLMHSCMTHDHGAPYYHIHRADYQAMPHRLTRTTPGVRTCLSAPFAPSDGDPARRRTTARHSITRHLTLSRQMWSASTRGFALKRKSDCVRVIEPTGRRLMEMR